MPTLTPACSLAGGRLYKNLMPISIPSLTEFSGRGTYVVRKRDGVVLHSLVAEIVLAREVFDRLRQATGGSAGVLEELCRDYVTEARATLGQLRQALAERNASEFREHAHYLKGSSMMIGAKTLAQCCAALEQMGRDSSLDNAAPMLELACAALRSVEAELTKELGPTALPSREAAAPAEDQRQGN